MADRRWLLGRLTTRRGMICPVDVADRVRMMSAILRGHGGSGVSTPCRSDRPGGSVTTDRFKVVRKGYAYYIIYVRSGWWAHDRNLRVRPSDLKRASSRSVCSPTTDNACSRDFFGGISRCALIFPQSNRRVESV